MKINIHSRPLRNNRGMTLIEVIIAIAVLSIGLLGVAMMQYMAIGGNTFSREMQTAIELSQELLEKAKAMPIKKTDGTAATEVITPGTHPTATDTAYDPDLANPVATGVLTRTGGVQYTRVWWVIDNCREGQVNDPIPAVSLCNPMPPAVCISNLNNLKTIISRTCWLDKNGGVHSVTLNGVRWDDTQLP